MCHSIETIICSFSLMFILFNFPKIFALEVAG